MRNGQHGSEQEKRVAAVRALRFITNAIIETVMESGHLGAPGGHIYAALMSQGCTLEQYETIMTELVRAGHVTKKGECYHAV